MALEDALVLAECLRRPETIPAALSAFEARRRPRTDWVRAQTHRRDRTRYLPTGGPKRGPARLRPKDLPIELPTSARRGIARTASIGLSRRSARRRSRWAPSTAPRSRRPRPRSARAAPAGRAPRRSRPTPAGCGRRGRAPRTGRPRSAARRPRRCAPTAEEAHLRARDADGDLDVRPAPLERLRAARPGGRRGRSPPGAVASSAPLPGGHDPRHAVDALLAAALREQVPDAGLEDEAERVEPARDDGGALAVAHVEAAPPPERPGDHRQMRDAVLLAEPAARIDVEELRGTAGAVLQLRGQRGEELQPGGGQLAAEPQLRRRADEERLGLDRVEARQLRPVAALQAIAARRAAHRDDRDARRCQCLRVPLHRPLGDLEPLGELDGGQLPARLQHQQERDETARAHDFESMW